MLNFARKLIGRRWVWRGRGQEGAQATDDRFAPFLLGRKASRTYGTERTVLVFLEPRCHACMRARWLLELELRERLSSLSNTDSKTERQQRRPLLAV